MGCKPCLCKGTIKIQQYTTNQAHPSAIKYTILKSVGTPKAKNRYPLVNSRQSIPRVFQLQKAKNLKQAPNQQESAQLLQVLQSHFILKNLNQETQKVVISSMKQYSIAPREIIFSQTDPAYSFFILTQGSLEVILDNIRINILKPNIGFGELALLDNTPRSATVKTMERSIVWSVDRDTFKQAVSFINQSLFQQNEKFIESVRSLENLTKIQKSKILELANVQNWETGQLIIREGDNGDLFYIIKEGSVVATHFNQEIRRMGPGEFFGQLALIHKTSRSANITALENVKLLTISKQNLKECFGKSFKQLIYRNSVRISLEKTQTFGNLGYELIRGISEGVKVVRFAQDETVVESGTQKGLRLYIVLKGLLQKKEKKYEKFSCIGESNIGFYSSDIISLTNSVLGIIQKSELEKIIGGEVQVIRNYNKIIYFLQQINIFRHLPIQNLQIIAKQAQKQTFPQNTCIFRQGQQGDSLYIIISGEVRIFKNDIYIRSLYYKSYFGERSLILNEPRSASAFTYTPVQFWVLNKTNLLSVLDTQIYSFFLNKIQLQDDSIQLSQLVFLDKLGKGMFGQVFLTKHQSKGSLYALKVISRNQLENLDLQYYLQIEQTVLSKLDHPMIMKLVKTFSEQTKVYLLLQYVCGADLFDVLRVKGLLSVSESRFYTACLVLILEHLHENKVVYRDLKPENVVIDTDGYPKLIDFGTTKILKGRTYTTIGTPYYMAPEVIVGAGHSFEADWWSLGVMVYEFVFGTVPFGRHTDDPHQIYKEVLGGQLQFEGYVKPVVRKFIYNLLNQKPYARLAREHSWLKNFKWISLILRTAKVPYKPEPTQRQYCKKKQSVPEYLVKLRV